MEYLTLGKIVKTIGLKGELKVYSSTDFGAKRYLKGNKVFLFNEQTKDIVEELVGDIWDEMDTVEEDYIVRNENAFLIDGSMNIEDFFNLVDLDIDDYEGD